MKIHFKLVILVLIGLQFFSCSPKITPQPTKDIDEKVTTDLVVEELKEVKVGDGEIRTDVAEGKSLFENNCGNCHKLNNPKDYTPQQWLPILSRMQKEANLTDAQHDKIYAYLSANQ